MALHDVDTDTDSFAQGPVARNRVLNSLRRTPIAVGEIVRYPHGLDRGRGELVRRDRYNRNRNRLLAAHDDRGRVFVQIYDANMRPQVPLTHLGNLPDRLPSTEENVRRWLNTQLGTTFVHATNRRGNVYVSGRGPDLVPTRFDDAFDDFVEALVASSAWDD